MKKKILFVSLIVIAVSIIASGTLAYFTSSETSHNIITTDAINITIEEWQKTDDGFVAYPEEPIVIMPGTSSSKIVTVRNIDAKAYVRAKYEIIVKDSRGRTMKLSPETINSIISVDLNNEDWIRKNDDDEWFYYASAVKTGEATEALFTKVIFDGPNMTNEYQNCTVEIIVDAQAVQSANNGNSATKASGWPAENN